MKQLKKTLLTLVALLVMTTGAWADELKVYTSAVAIADLKVGDILADGFSLTGEYEWIYFDANKHKLNGELSTNESTIYTCTSINSYGPNCVITAGENTYAPVDQGKDGSANARMAITVAEQTTGIDAMDNGQMINDNLFDLNGREVQKPVKGGVYIINNKKVMIKK